LEVAESIKFFNPNLKIIFNKRIGDIPHNGYRIFDISALKKLIGDYKFHTIESYLYKHYKKYN
jgi:hypothetical protein